MISASIVKDTKEGSGEINTIGLVQLSPKVSLLHLNIYTVQARRTNYCNILRLI